MKKLFSLFLVLALLAGITPAVLASESIDYNAIESELSRLATDLGFLPGTWEDEYSLFFVQSIEQSPGEYQNIHEERLTGKKAEFRRDHNAAYCDFSVRYASEFALHPFMSDIAMAG